jgi:hypothetical protein
VHEAEREDLDDDDLSAQSLLRARLRLRGADEQEVQDLATRSIERRMATSPPICRSVAERVSGP